jgi:L-asparaginase II
MSSAPSPCPIPLTRVTRGGILESLHRGHVAASRPDGSLALGLGDTDFPTYLRSAAKPFQAIPVVEEGAADRYGFSDDELALFCGSVSGQDFHVATVRSVLAKSGMDESLLACGVHKPSHGPTARRMAERGEPALPVHNNCAGKHAAMLALCAHKGWEPAGYTSPDHPVQTLIRRTVAECCGMAPEALETGTDGCGVPVFRAPLRAVARGYALLARPEEVPDLSVSRAAAVRRLMEAAAAHPEMVAGDERLCTDVMRAGRKSFFAKTGAEGSYGLAFFGNGLGIALKVEDGSQRALGPVVVEILLAVGALSEEEARGLVSHHRPLVKNHRKETVGTVEPALEPEHIAALAGLGPVRGAPG